MEKSIKLKSGDESFMDYLRNNNLIGKENFFIKKEELAKYFDFENDKVDDLIKVSLNTFKEFYRCKILSKNFIFYQTMREIKIEKPDKHEYSIKFQSPKEEGKYIKNIISNPNLYDLYMQNENGKFEKKDLEKNIILDIKNNYKIVEKAKPKLDNIKFTPYYQDYIDIINSEAYKEFSFKDTTTRKKFFDDLDEFLSYDYRDFFPICGFSGSGKTTSILYYINENRNEFNIFYINCFTILRKDLTNEEIKDILSYELKNSVKNYPETSKLFITQLDSIFKEDVERDNKFLFDLIKKIMDIYNNEIIFERLTIVIDQYSSKYDLDNEYIFNLIKQLNKKTNNCQIILISSMNNTCVSSNMQKSMKRLKYSKDDEKCINYCLYGQLFDISDIIKKEKNEIKDIMEQDFGNSALIYYNLKSQLLYIDDNNESLRNEIISHFITEEKNDIIFEIESFYNIIHSKQEKKIKLTKTIVSKILYVLEIMKNMPFYNYRDIPDLFEKFPMKYFRILYNEIDLGHPEFISLLPKKFRDEIKKLKDTSDLQEQNSKCPLKNYLKNNLEDLNEFLLKFTKNKREIIRFFTIEPIYPILKEILKELIFYYNIEENIVKEIYYESSGGKKGDFFEYIFLNFVKSEKKFLGLNFEVIENINSIVPYYFSINKFSHRLFIKKQKNEIIINKIKDKNVDKIDEDEIIEENKTVEENNINTQEKSEDNTKKLKYDKKKYTKQRDYHVFVELKKIINNQFNQNAIKEEKNLPKKNIYLNQLNSNGKYVDGGLLIFKGENNKKLNFELIVIQVSIKRDKDKIYNKNETSLILTYIKEYLEKCYSNINITKISFYYIIDFEDQDNTIKDKCNNYSIGCYGFNVSSKVLTSVNKCNLTLNRFSKFNSCFILNSISEIDNNIIEEIDEKEPNLFENIKKDILNKYFEPFFDKDISIPDNFYIYKDLILNLKIYKHLTNYALLITLNEINETIEYIVLNEKKVLDYTKGDIININDIQDFKNSFRLIVFLIPMKLKGGI